jgi:hypothetical protein
MDSQLVVSRLLETFLLMCWLLGFNDCLSDWDDKTAPEEKLKFHIFARIYC